MCKPCEWWYLPELMCLAEFFVSMLEQGICRETIHCVQRESCEMMSVWIFVFCEIWHCGIQRNKWKIWMLLFCPFMYKGHLIFFCSFKLTFCMSHFVRCNRCGKCVLSLAVGWYCVIYSFFPQLCVLSSSVLTKTQKCSHAIMFSVSWQMVFMIFLAHSLLHCKRHSDVHLVKFLSFFFPLPVTEHPFEISRLNNVTA